jgi:hypothetical protein
MGVLVPIRDAAVRLFAREGFAIPVRLLAVVALAGFRRRDVPA